jgi:hypothetical protein
VLGTSVGEATAAGRASGSRGDLIEGATQEERLSSRQRPDPTNHESTGSTRQ